MNNMAGRFCFYRMEQLKNAFEKGNQTNPHKKMRVDAWISTFSITHYDFQRGNLLP